MIRNEISNFKMFLSNIIRIKEKYLISSTIIKKKNSLTKRLPKEYSNSDQR